MTALAAITAAKTDIEKRAAVTEFGRLARLVVESKSLPAQMRALAEGRRLPERLQRIIEKAEPGSISAPGGSPETWGGAFLAYDELSTAFLASLSNANLFDSALPDMVPTPVKTRVPMSSVAVVATIVGESDPKGVSELDLSNAALEPVKAAALLVVSNDLLRLGGRLAAQLFNAELVKGVALATDAHFISTLIAATTPFASTGTFLSDLGLLLDAVEGSADSRYYLAIEPGNAKQLAVQPSATGGRQHPELGVNGGSVGGITVVVTDSLQSGQLLLFDARQVAADGGIVGLDASENATLDMSGSTNPTFSLFQRNCSALRAERMFGFKLLRSTAAASVSGASYSAGSPA